MICWKVVLTRLMQMNAEKRSMHFWLVVFSFRTGLRPDTFFNLTLGCFDEGTLPNGRRYLVPDLGVIGRCSGQRGPQKPGPHQC